MPKLVRDRIPELILGTGKTVYFHVASEKEFSKMLCEKLQEEVSEFLESKETEEIVDILEVIYAICKTKGVSLSELENHRIQKGKDRGVFQNKYILEEVE